MELFAAIFVLLLCLLGLGGVVAIGLEVVKVSVREVRERRLRRLRKMKRRGLCLRCGYDLRRSPERCPECGARAEEQVVR